MEATFVDFSETGFTLLAINFFASGRDVLGAFFFVLSLGFKQMALYYAPAIGTYLLAKCLYLGPSQGYVDQNIGSQCFSDLFFCCF